MASPGCPGARLRLPASSHQFHAWQLVNADAGPRGSFIGAVPAALPSEWLQRLIYESMKLATVLQALGYFSRCRFDAVLAGSSLDNAKLHWIERNGRWGGLSVPMTLANRLTGGKRGGLTIVQASGMNVPSRSMSDIKTILGRTLFPSNGEQEGIVILSPTVFEMGTGLHFMAIARTQAAADAMADVVFQPLSH